MNNHFKLGKPLNVIWHFKRPDGENYSLAGLQHELVCYNSRGRFKIKDSVINVEDTGVLSFTLKEEMQTVEGAYSFHLSLLRHGKTVNTVVKNDAIILSKHIIDTDSIQEDEPTTIDIFSVGEFELFRPTAPVAGSDGWWYFDGQPILDDEGNKVPINVTIDIDDNPESETFGVITLDKGRDEGRETVITGMRNTFLKVRGQGDTTEAQGIKAERQGNTAESQGNVAQEQGNVAETQGLTAKAQGEKTEQQGNIAEQKGSYAAQLGNTAEEQGNTAKQRGERAEQQGNTAEAQGNVAEQQGLTAKAQGERAEAQGNTTEAQGMQAIQISTDKGDEAISIAQTAADTAYTAAANASTAAQEARDGIAEMVTAVENAKDDIIKEVEEGKLAELESEVAELEKVTSLGLANENLWINGSTSNTNGSVIISEKRRIVLRDIIRVYGSIRITALNGFRFAIWQFTDNEGNNGVDSGWLTTKDISAGSFVRIQITRTTEDMSEIANIAEFLANIKFEPIYIYDIETIEQHIETIEQNIETIEQNIDNTQVTHSYTIPQGATINLDDRTWDVNFNSNPVIIKCSFNNVIKGYQLWVNGATAATQVRQEIYDITEFTHISSVRIRFIPALYIKDENNITIGGDVSYSIYSESLTTRLESTEEAIDSIEQNIETTEEAIDSIEQNIETIKDDIEAIKATYPSDFEKIIGFTIDTQVKLENLKLCNLIQREKNNTNGKTLFTLLHFSDNHNCADNLALYDELLTKFDTYIDAALNTGDLTGGTINTVVTDYEKYAPKIMLAVGNHDASSHIDGSYYMASSDRVYDKFLANYISQWGVIVGGTKKNYFYKDFPSEESGVNGIRLIVLDNYNNNQDGVYTSTNILDIDQSEQVTWLQTILADARQNNLSVICAHHEPVYKHSREWMNAWALRDVQKAIGSEKRFTESIKDFIDNGGDFVCWLSGHLHRDDINTIVSDNRQIDMNINCSGYTNLASTDGAMIKGTPSQVCANLIAVDTLAKQIKVLRIGRKQNRYLEIKNSIVINYGDVPSVVTIN